MISIARHCRMSSVVSVHVDLTRPEACLAAERMIGESEPSAGRLPSSLRAGRPVYWVWCAVVRVLEGERGFESPGQPRRTLGADQGLRAASEFTAAAREIWSADRGGGAVCVLRANLDQLPGSGVLAGVADGGGGPGDRGPRADCGRVLRFGYVRGICRGRGARRQRRCWLRRRNRTVSSMRWWWGSSSGRSPAVRPRP
jgi:hypothetical protein